MSTSPDPFDEVVLDDTFIAGGRKESSADERIAQANRIGRANNRLKAEGEIADGSGKPRYQRLRKSTPWIVLGAVIGVAIIVVVLIIRSPGGGLDVAAWRITYDAVTYGTVSYRRVGE